MPAHMMFDEFSLDADPPGVPMPKDGLKASEDLLSTYSWILDAGPPGDGQNYTGLPAALNKKVAFFSAVASLAESEFAPPSGSQEVAKVPPIREMVSICLRITAPAAQALTPCMQIATVSKYVRFALCEGFADPTILDSTHGFHEIANSKIAAKYFAAMKRHKVWCSRKEAPKGYAPTSILAFGNAIIRFTGYYERATEKRCVHTAPHHTSPAFFSMLSYTCLGMHCAPQNL